MKIKIFFLSLFLCSFTSVHSIPETVRWVLTTKQVKEKVYEISLTALLSPGWHIYAQKQPMEAISIPTSVKFPKSPFIKLIGEVKEIGDKETYANTDAGITQYQYENKVTFVQLIEIKTQAKYNFKIKVSWQACTESMCLPEQTKEFEMTTKSSYLYNGSDLTPYIK